MDETNAHLHAYILPSDLKAMGLHPGAAAKRAVTSAGLIEGEDAKALNRRGDAAYKAAMREWQDSYWQSVGLQCGLARLGPARRRLSRAEWQAERVAAWAAKVATDRVARIERNGEEFVAKLKGDATAFVERTKKQAAEISAGAEAAKVAAINQASAAKALQDAAKAKERKASTVVDRASIKARHIVAAAQLQASQISSWGGQLRSFLDGLRHSSIEASARRAAAAEVERERYRADEASRRLIEETSKCQEAERRARRATESAQVTARERDIARQELAAMRPTAASEVLRGMKR